MTQNSRRQKVMIAVVLSLFVLVMQVGLMAQNLGTAPQVNVAVQGQQGTQPEGTFLNLTPAAQHSWRSAHSPWGVDSASGCSRQSDFSWSPVSHDCWSSGLPKALVELLRPTFGRRDGGGPAAPASFFWNQRLWPLLN